MQITRELYDGEGNIISTESLDIDIRPLAKDALAKSDMVALRCFKASVPFPEEWKDYVLALRSVVNGESEEMPEKPDFPEN